MVRGPEEEGRMKRKQLASFTLRPARTSIEASGVRGPYDAAPGGREFLGGWLPGLCGQEISSSLLSRVVHSGILGAQSKFDR